VKIRSLLIPLAKIVISGLLLWFVLSRYSITEIKQAIGQPRWELLGCAFLVYGLSAVGGAWQWSWILRQAHFPAPGAEVRRLYYIGLFFNNFLPANIGGDVYKIVDLGRHYRQPLKVFCSTLLDRLIGLSSLTMLALVVATVAITQQIDLPMLTLALFAAMALLYGGLGLMLSKRVSSRIPALFVRLGMDNLAQQIENTIREFRIYRERPGWFSLIFLFSGGVQFLRIFTHVVVAWALNIQLDFVQIVQLFVLVPMLAISLTLPITVNGIGLRETVTAYLLTFAGLATPVVVAMEIVAFLVQVAFSLLGGFLFLLGKNARNGLVDNNK